MFFEIAILSGIAAAGIVLLVTLQGIWLAVEWLIDKLIS